MTTCDPSTTISAQDISGLKADITTIDTVVESPELTTTTKNGVVIDTLAGRLLQLGYLPPVAYAAGITFTSQSDLIKTIDRGGVVYAPYPSAIPFTTSGTWAGDDEDKFYVVQQEIWYRFESIAALLAQPAGFTKWVLVQGYYGVGTGGGGELFWDPANTDTPDNVNTFQSDDLPPSGRWVRARFGYIDLLQAGIKVDGSTDNAQQLVNLEAFLRSNGGGVVASDVDGDFLSSEPFICPPEVTWDAKARLVNTSAVSGRDFGVFFGQGNREDIGRSKGVAETAHDVGALTAGQVQVTVGLRWNNATTAFDQAATWVPQVGDLCMICTTDNTDPDPTRPIPTSTHHRRVEKAVGSAVTLDKGVYSAGNYMIIPTSRGLGYDRTPYGGYGRMETVRGVKWRGDVFSQNGFPMLVGGIIASSIEGDFSGRGSIYCNGLRDTVIKTTGWFSRNAYEVAIGSEDFDISCDVVYIDTGETLTSIACTQIGERARSGTVREIRVSADGWNGNDLFSVFGENIRVIDQEIFGSATLRCVVIGAISSSANCFKSDRLRVESNGAMTGRLLETTNADDIDLDISVVGETSNADAAIIRDSGRIKCLHVGTDTGIIRVEGEYLIHCVKQPAGGTLVATTTRVDRNRVKPQILSGYIAAETYAATLAPTQDFKMILTGALELQDPTGTFEVGDQLSMRFQQDGVGGHDVTYAAGSLYRGFVIPTGAGATDRLTLTFEWDGSVWVCLATNGAWV